VRFCAGASRPGGPAASNVEILRETPAGTISLNRMPISNKKRSRSTTAQRIFVTVLGGVAEVDPDTVPNGIEVEIIDIDDLKADSDAAAWLSRQARSYAKRNGFL